MSQRQADRTLDVLLGYGVNHIDTAASYGQAETTWALDGPVSLPIFSGHQSRRAYVRPGLGLDPALAETIAGEQVDMFNSTM